MIKARSPIHFNRMIFMTFIAGENFLGACIFGVGRAKMELMGA